MTSVLFFNFFFFNDTATTEIYTLSLHDALPIYNLTGKYVRFLGKIVSRRVVTFGMLLVFCLGVWLVNKDRKSTRLNSSHSQISYAVFCLKKKRKKIKTTKS